MSSKKQYGVTGYGLEPTPNDSKFTIVYGNLNNMVSHLEGKLLTIMEASISNKEQLEAVKSLVRQTIWTTVQELPLESN